MLELPFTDLWYTSCELSVYTDDHRFRGFAKSIEAFSEKILADTQAFHVVSIEETFDVLLGVLVPADHYKLLDTVRLRPSFLQRSCLTVSLEPSKFKPCQPSHYAEVEPRVVGGIEFGFAVAKQTIFKVIETKGEGLYEFSWALGLVDVVVVEAKVDIKEDFLAVELRVSLYFQS